MLTWARAALGRARGCVIDYDSAFAYRTKAFVDIRDWRLGVLSYSLRFAIFCYVVVYQIVLLQAYNVASAVVGTVRVSLLEPELQFRSDAHPPYCLGVTNSTDPEYTFPAPGEYAFDGGNPAPQGVCRYLDALYAVPDSLESAALLLPSRIVATLQAASPPTSACAGLLAPDCTWDTVSSELQYVPDIGFFTLLADHSFASVSGRLSRSSTQLTGAILDSSGRAVDPCAPYTRAGFACPPYVTVGSAGDHDIFPIWTLLDAAGVRSLDQGGGDGGGLANETLRYSGVVVLLSISYTNYFLNSVVGGAVLPGTGSFNSSVVRYAYSVTVVPNAEFKAETFELAGNASGVIPAPSRIIYNRHGVRIVIVQSGRIGFFDFQALMINLVVGLGLLAVSDFVVDFFATFVCPQKHLYRRYMYRATVALGDLTGGEEHAKLMHRVREDSYSVDPPPPALAEIVAERSALRHRGSGAVLPDGAPSGPLRRSLVVSSQQALQRGVSAPLPTASGGDGAGRIVPGPPAAGPAGGGSGTPPPKGSGCIDGGVGAAAPGIDWAERAGGAEPSFRGQATSPLVVRNPLVRAGSATPREYEFSAGGGAGSAGATGHA